jgi:hypothetical protein
VMSLTQSSGIGSATFQPAGQGKIWTLSGQQVKHPQKGIYITNGTKYILR